MQRLRTVKVMTETLSLELPAKKVFQPVLAGFLIEGMRSWNIPEADALALRLASEEVFRRIEGLAERLETKLTYRTHGLELTFAFRLGSVDLHRLNLVAEERSSRSDWLVVSRFLDRLKVSHGFGGRLELALSKDRSYRQLAETLSPLDIDWQLAELRRPNERELQLFTARLSRSCDPERLSPFLHKPGKLRDMLASGNLDIQLALDGQSDPLGGTILDLRDPRWIHIHGPFDFTQDRGLGETLMENLEERLQAHRPGLLAADPALYRAPQATMELGVRRLRLHQDAELTVAFQLRPNIGRDGVVWTDERLRPFLEAEYQRLGLQRELQDWQQGLRPTKGRSVISCDLDREYRDATLRPVLAGGDIADNLRRHLERLNREGYLNACFELDLGDARQLRFLEPLAELGFSPAYLLPNAGRSDLLVFLGAGEPPAA